MTKRPTAIERAYALARSGQCAGIQDIKRRLRDEGYTAAEAHLFGATLTTALRKLCSEARTARRH
jgi:hypothetical protein